MDADQRVLRELACDFDKIKTLEQHIPIYLAADTRMVAADIRRTGDLKINTRAYIQRRGSAVICDFSAVDDNFTGTCRLDHAVLDSRILCDHAAVHDECVVVACKIHSAARIFAAALQRAAVDLQLGVIQVKEPAPAAAVDRSGIVMVIDRHTAAAHLNERITLSKVIGCRDRMSVETDIQVLLQIRSSGQLDITDKVIRRVCGSISRQRQMRPLKFCGSPREEAAEVMSVIVVSDDRNVFFCAHRKGRLAVFQREPVLVADRAAGFIDFDPVDAFSSVLRSNADRNSIA